MFILYTHNILCKLVGHRWAVEAHRKVTIFAVFSFKIKMPKPDLEGSNFRKKFCLAACKYFPMSVVNGQ